MVRREDLGKLVGDVFVDDEAVGTVSQSSAELVLLLNGIDEGDERISG